jgi:hypothetical protein
MMGHQDICMKSRLIAIQSLRQNLQVKLVILIIKKCGLAVVPALNEMNWRPRNKYSRLSWYSKFVLLLTDPGILIQSLYLFC